MPFPLPYSILRMLVGRHGRYSCEISHQAWQIKPGFRIDEAYDGKGVSLFFRIFCKSDFFETKIKLFLVVGCTNIDPLGAKTLVQVSCHRGNC